MRGAHVEIAVGVDPGAFEIIIGALTAEGFEGFWEDGNVLRAYISRERWDASRLDSLRTMIGELAARLAIPPPSLALTIIPEENWNRTWEETIRPLRVSDRIVIAPTWHPYRAAPGDIVITIDPKMSFGTGYHETTRLMVRLVERHARPGIRVLDAGTGTGIIAIAALRLGAKGAVGFDTDEWAFANARENALLNGVADRFTVIHGALDVVPPGAFELVAANIQKNVIEEMLPGLISRLAPGGTLLVSGLLSTDDGAMRGILRRAGLIVGESTTEAEWVAYAAGRA
ncbi:MAG TPA: 50S ribosomal protein L11 methyltransferase [Bacteroidota bacterium]|nr:50S ribosomal protein L11 methyltransferase [Bacteroidota bacterium]